MDAAQRENIVAGTMSGTLKRIAVFGGKGGGGHAAQTILNLARSGAPYAFAGYINDRQPIGSELYGGKVLCGFDAWPSLDEEPLLPRATAPGRPHAAKLCSRFWSSEFPTHVGQRWSIRERWSPTIPALAQAPTCVAFASISLDSAVGAHCALRSRRARRK